MSERWIEPGKPEHFPMILPDLRPSDAAECAAWGDGTLVRVELYCEKGLADTLMVDGRPIAMLGVIPVWQGVGESWALTTDNVDVFPKWLHQAALDLLGRAEKEFGLSRVQSTVRADNTRAGKWHEALGFELETDLPMRKFGPDGMDYYLYARVR